jgi:uncharacterized glyoxalase superfamily protein PhnB
MFVSWALGVVLATRGFSARDFVDLTLCSPTLAIEGHPMKLNRLIPMLPVRSISASVQFYQKLGFTVEDRNDDWRWAMLCFGECRLMVDESINTHSAIPRSCVLYLYPDDVLEFHEHLRSNGVAVPELQVTFYEMTEFRIDDPDGNRLWIGQNASTQS